MVKINNFCITGSLGQDPKLDYVGANKVAKLTISVAVYRTKDKTDWFQVEVWGSNFNGTVNNKRPEMYANRLTKGSRVGVSGSVHIDEYNGKYYTKVNANNIDMISGLKVNENQGSYTPPVKVLDSDLPF